MKRCSTAERAERTPPDQDERAKLSRSLTLPGNFLRRSGLSEERSRPGTADVVSRIPNGEWPGLRGHRFDLHG